MGIYYSLFVAVSLVIFFLILIQALKRESYSFKTVKVINDKNIEPRLRLLMLKNPRSEIVVLNHSTISETGEILEKMRYDFPRIHIVTY